MLQRLDQLYSSLNHRSALAELVCYLTDTGDDQARRIANAGPPFDRTAQRQAVIAQSDGRISGATTSGIGGGVFLGTA